MRKMFLCTLLVLGFMNFSFGQFNTNSERISVKTYDTKGLVEQFQLRGSEAVSFDIPAFILENDHLERVLINGSLRTNLTTTIIQFDSNNQDQELDYICTDIESKLTPFLGVWGHGRRDLTGVDIKSIVPSTSAERARMVAGEIITQFDGVEIYNFADLKNAVLSSEIGERVELKLQNDTKEYSTPVIVGSRGLKTINYRYCQEEQKDIIGESNVITDDISFITYPNPTRSVSRVNFKTTSNEDATFSVTDITGSLIHKEVFSDFDGNLRVDYNLINENAGTYIFTIQQGKELYTSKVQLIKD